MYLLLGSLFQRVLTFQFHLISQNTRTNISLSNNLWSMTTVLPLPDHWVTQPRDEQGKEEQLHLASLLRESEEFRKIKDKFLKSLSKVNIVSIERIQNPSLYYPYMARKQSMEEKNGTQENELQLFHGTKHESVKAINLQGFNRSFCGQNGKS